MHWNCPHCGVALSVATDLAAGGWAFSRCYQCGGHALVRRAELNVIKVDKAPPGEQCLLPEAPKATMVTKPPPPFPNWTEEHLEQTPSFTERLTVKPHIKGPLLGAALGMTLITGILVFSQMGVVLSGNTSPVSSQQSLPAPEPLTKVQAAPDLMLPPELLSAQRSARYVQTKRTHMRVGPGTGFTSLRQLDPTEPLDWIRSEASWDLLKVRGTGQTGWVRRDLLSHD